MIELPEIETIRRDLERDCVGKKIKTVEVLKTKTVGGAKSKASIEKELDQAKGLCEEVQAKDFYVFDYE